MLDMQLRTFRKHFVELIERAGDEVRLRVIVTGQGVGTLHDPIDVIGDVGKKFPSPFPGPCKPGERSLL